MALRRVANAVGALRDQIAQEHAHVEARAAYGKVVGRPFAGFVLAPGLAQPLAVGLEAAAGHHTGPGRYALLAHPCRHETAVLQFQAIDRRLITDLHPQPFGAAVVGIDQRLAAAHEKGVGARQVQGARQRGLKAHAVLAHPAAAARGLANRQPRQLFVGLAAGDLEQVLPILLLRVSAGQHILRRLVHAAQIARVAGVATAPFTRRRLQQQHAGARLACHQRGTQRGIAAANDQYIDHPVLLLAVQSA